MDNDLIVINNNTDASTSNSKNEFHSLNNNSFNHLSKTNSNNIGIKLKLMIIFMMIQMNIIAKVQFTKMISQKIFQILTVLI